MIIVQAHDLIQYKCLIPDIECFAKYVSVVCSQSPKRLNVLLGYMCHIVRVSHRYKWLSWFAYNQNLFRSSRQWNKRVGMHRSQVYMLSVLWVRLGVRKLNAGPATCLTTTLIPAHWNPLNPNAQSLPLHRPLLPKVCRKNKFGKIVTLGSSASMFMHALCAVGSAAGENYLGSNSWQFSAT